METVQYVLCSIVSGITKDGELNLIADYPPGNDKLPVSGFMF